MVALAGLLSAGGAGAHHNPPPLPDPIPGTIPAGPFTVELADIVSTLVYPTNATAAPDGSDRIFVTLRDGRIVLVKNGVLQAMPVLDISATTVLDAGSALSVVTFHPNFGVAGNPGERKFYTLSQEAAGSGVGHFGGPGEVHQSVLYEWQMDSGNPDVADLSSKREILRINDQTTVHNSNDLAFGPDGYLYVANGDDDLDDEDSLDPTSIHGTILRLDIDATVGNGRYSIPPDNPFVGNSTGMLEEIFAWGFRNPWRIAFHPDGRLYVADIGEDDIEEINVMSSGEYYGWNDKEGSFAFLGFNVGVTDDLTDLPPGFAGIDPLAEYDHTEGDRSITGGFFYRGSRIPPLAGHYIFGDLISGRLMHLDPVTNAIQEIEIDPAGVPLGSGIIAFGESPAGEILVVVMDYSFNPTGRLVEVVSGVAPGLLPDGDVTLDGRLGIADLLLLQQALAGLAELGPASAWHADLHPAGGGDGETDLRDLLALERLLAP